MKIDGTEVPITKIVIYSVLAIMGLTIIGSFLGVFSSVATAPGRVIQKTLQTDNIIQNYEWFFDVNASYIARHDQVMQFKQILSEEEDTAEKRRLRMELAAMQQVCRKLATRYNANSEKMNTGIFKGWQLPTTLNMQSCN